MSLVKELETKVENLPPENSLQKAKRILNSKSGLKMLAIISFLESALLLPILTDPFIMAAILLDKTKTVKVVVVSVLASAVGGIFAYFTATFFLETILHFLSPEMVQQFEIISTTNDSNTFMLTILGAITPIPYTLVVWAIAVLDGSLLVFIIASILGRGLRYSIVGYSTYRFGSTALHYIKRYIGLISIGLLMVGAGYLWLKV